MSYVTFLPRLFLAHLIEFHSIRHASIPAATRAARGLPEDLIRLCVGIEDPSDLLDDLERALIDAGAVRRTLQGVERVRTTIDEAVAKLALESQISQSESVQLRPHEKQWFVSSPGKVILFGEHAVVYGVPALAASVSLRCYAITTPHRGTLSHTVGVHFIDIDADDKKGGFRYQWDISNLPWKAVPGESRRVHPLPDSFTLPFCDQSLLKPTKFLSISSFSRKSPELRFQRHWGLMHAKPLLHSCIYT